MRFTAANEIALEHWGKSLPDVLGMRLPDVFPAAIGSRPYEAHLRTLRSPTPFHEVMVSPLLAEPIDLQIYPEADGLRVSFLKVHSAMAQRGPASA